MKLHELMANTGRSCPDIMATLKDVGVINAHGELPKEFDDSVVEHFLPVVNAAAEAVTPVEPDAYGLITPESAALFNTLAAIGAALLMLKAFIENTPSAPPEVATEFERLQKMYAVLSGSQSTATENTMLCAELLDDATTLLADAVAWLRENFLDYGAAPSNEQTDNPNDQE